MSTIVDGNSGGTALTTTAASIAGSVSGAITLVAPSVAGTNTLTLPAVTDTVAIQSQAVRQVVSTQTGAMTTGSTVIPADDTIPQITEGNEYMTCTITPKSTTSRLIIEVVLTGATSATGTVIAALVQDATSSALAAGFGVSAFSNLAFSPIKFTHTMTSGTVAATTFRVRAGSNNVGTLTFNGMSGVRSLGGVMASSIVITEIGS